jgi:hypothetical protein
VLKNIATLDVDADGNPWLTTTKRELYLYKNGEYILHPGDVTSVTVGSDGSVWILDAYGLESKLNTILEKIYLLDAT